MKLIKNFIPLAFLLYTCSHVQQSSAEDDVERKEAFMSSISGLNPNAYVHTKMNAIEKKVEKALIPITKPLDKHSEHSAVSTSYEFKRNQHIKFKRSIEETEARRQKRATGAGPIKFLGFLISVPRKISRV
nr:unnamed protein product [Callosobruchus analis]